VFDKIQTVQPGTIVENKRLGAALALVKQMQDDYPHEQRRYHPARQRPPNNLEAPGMPSKCRPSRAVIAALAEKAKNADDAPGTVMILSGWSGLKGCAARTGKAGFGP
jgi:hypothetical protein